MPFNNLSNKVFLAQGDTTVGFLSQDAKSLFEAKERDGSKKFLKVVDSLLTLKEFTRVPNRFKRVVRYAKKSTFIYPNGAFRVSPNETILNKYRWLYSTSANRSGCSFDITFAKSKCDIIVLDRCEFSEKTPSKLIKLHKNRLKRLR
jgi:tRNA A37 threonylcarbamoyladenosine synthetase subunit TsaC/SUA5/YrdC